MRRKGTGYVEPQPDGTFRGRLPTGERLRKVATHAEASDILDAALVALAALPSAGLTLRTFGSTWLDERERAGSRGMTTDRSRWRTHVEGSTLADTPLRNITRGDVRAWLGDLLCKHAAPGGGATTTLERCLSRSTVQSTINLLRVCLETAVQRELLVENPARGVRLPRSAGATHDPWTYLEPDEQAALLGSSAPAPLRLLIAFALGTGLRQGEVWNLELADVQGERVVVRYGSKGRATKSGKIRRVPLFGVALEAVRAWLPLLAAQPNPHGLLWPLPSGARRPRGKAPEGWRGALEAAGIVAARRHDGRPVRWHDLRHSAASSLVAGWWGRRWTLEEVRALLGHSSITVTERYAHLGESALEVAARATVGAADRPTMGPWVDEADAAEVAGIAGAPPARIGRATFGLGRLDLRRQDPEVSALLGVIVGASVEGLEAIARGGPHAWSEVRRVLVEINRQGRAAQAALEAPAALRGAS